MLRAACLIACTGLCYCTSAQVSQPAPAQAEAPAQVELQPEAPAAAPAVAPPQAAPQRPVHKAAGKSFPKRKSSARRAEPPPAETAPEPPVVIVPVISPEQERARRLSDYIAALQRAQLTFDPPSPMEVERRVAVQLSLNPPKETAQLAEDLRKSLSDPGAWRPRLRAQLGGASFEMAPVEAMDLSGEKDLSPAGRSEWTWNVLPKLPGTKQLVARVAILLPPGLGEPRELAALQREVTVEATLAWTLGNLWSEYWLWILAMLALALGALAWWRRQPSGEE